MDQTQWISELLRLVRRRLLLVLLVFGTGIVATLAYALSRPASYATTAKILVEGQQISADLARSTVTLSAPARLQLIEQRLMARDSLIAMIERLGLFADLPLKMGVKVTLLRAATRIESISAAGQAWGSGESLSAFTITVELGDPEQAARVANAFVEAAIAQNIEVRAERARETLAYFDAEDRRVGMALADIETEITAFKTANEEALPESLDARRASLDRIADTSLELDRRVLELEERRAELVAALASDGPTAAAPSPADLELKRLELELAQRRRLLAANHPDLRRLEQQLAAVAALVAPGTAEDDAERLRSPRRAAIEQQVLQLDAQMAQLRDQAHAFALQRQEIDRSIHRTPEVELALGALERQRLELQEQYSDVARRRAEARTGEQLEANRQSERFEVVEAALVPDEPIGPNRKKLVLAGTAASAALAAGLVVLLEILSPALRTTGQLERRLNLRPVVAIPYVARPGEIIRRRARKLALLVLALVGVWFAVPLIDRHVVPVTPLFQEAAARLGVAGVRP